MAKGTVNSASKFQSFLVKVDMEAVLAVLKGEFLGEICLLISGLFQAPDQRLPQ